MLEALSPVLVCLVALILDRLLGEPKYHPLAVFGHAASWLEQRLNNRKSRFKGAAATLLVMGLPVGFVLYLQLSISNS